VRVSVDTESGYRQADFEAGSQAGCLIATDASLEPAKLDEGIRYGVRDLGERWAIPTAAAESFLLLPAGHRSFAPSRSDPGPLSMIN
jgi:hypothetical protein